MIRGKNDKKNIYIVLIITFNEAVRDYRNK